MSLAVARPTFVLDDTAVEASPWSCCLDAHGAEVGDLRSWDDRTPVKIERTVKLDLEQASKQLGLSHQLPKLQLVIRKGTGFGAAPRDLELISTHDVYENEGSFTITACIEPSKLAGKLFLLSDIVLAENIRNTNPLVPKTYGTRLWSESYAADLEHGLQQFPCETASFNQIYSGRNWIYAPWFLRWYDTNPNQEISSAIRLFVNIDTTDQYQRIQSLDPATLQTMMGDVITQVIERVGFPEAASADEDYPPGSIGNQATEWRKRAFPSLDLATVREILEHRPEEFRSSVLASAMFRTEVI